MNITIEKLCVKLKEKLEKCSSLLYFYVGETDNMVEAEKRHKKEGYSNTFPIAKATHSLITMGEEALIEFFKQSNLKDQFKNESDNSVGSKTATYLYVSLSIKPQSIEELDDDDFTWPEIYTLTR